MYPEVIRGGSLLAVCPTSIDLFLPVRIRFRVAYPKIDKDFSQHELVSLPL